MHEASLLLQAAALGGAKAAGAAITAAVWAWISRRRLPPGD
jgi:hypothetical protein